MSTQKDAPEAQNENDITHTIAVSNSKKLQFSTRWLNVEISTTDLIADLLKSEKIPIGETIYNPSTKKKQQLKARECYIQGALLEDFSTRPKTKMTGRRKMANILSLSIVSYDIDDGMTIPGARKLLKASGYRSVLYPTHSHSEEKHKFRAVVFFDEPFMVNGMKGVKQWKRIYQAIAENIGLNVVLDQSCKDTTRLLNMPAHSDLNEGLAVPELINPDGQHIHIADFMSATHLPEETASAIVAANNSNAYPDTFWKEFNVSSWYNEFGHSFKMAALLNDKTDLKYAERPDGGYEIHCPEADLHSNGESTGAWVTDGCDEHKFYIGCSHGTSCASRSHIQRLIALLEAGTISVEDLQSETYGGGIVETVQEKTEKLLETITKDSLIDELHAVLDMLATSDDLLFHDDIIEKLVSRSGKGKGLLKEQLKKKLSVTVPLVIRADGDIDVIEEEEMWRRVETYCSTWAQISIGGRVFYLNKRKIDAMLHDKNITIDDCLYETVQFTKENKKDNIHVIENGDIVRKNIAVLFDKNPPDILENYTGGFVFAPLNDNPPNTWNIYNGFKVKPSPDGSCELFYNLIREVWCNGDEELFEWDKEYLMDILANPTGMVKTARAIRSSEQQVGKSIILEQFMKHILGDLLLVVSRKEDLLGAHNTLAAFRLVIFLDEVAFAGDRALFDQIKALITGIDMYINPKGKPHFHIDNYARFFLASNHMHFLNLDKGDERYTVSEASNAWKNTKKFAEALRQWTHEGGAERFLYDALNHPFRTLEHNTSMKVINRPYVTDESVKQRAESRPPCREMRF